MPRKQFALTRFPLLLILLPLVLGYATGDIFLLAHVQDAVWIFLLAVVCFFWCILGLCVPSVRISLGWIKIFFVFCVFLAAIAHYLHQYHQQQIVWSKEKVTMSAVVSAQRYESEKGKTYLFRLLSPPYAGQKIQVFVLGQQAQLNIGDELIFRSRIYAPNRLHNPGETDYATQLVRQEISGTSFLTAQDWRLLRKFSSSPNDLFRLLGNDRLHWSEALRLYRQSLIAQYAPYFSKHELGVLVAMSLGDKSLLQPSSKALYSHTGASHVLALSGLHLAIIYAVFDFLLLRLLRRYSFPIYLVASVLMMVLLWAYTFLADMPLSLLRACVMFCLGRCFLFFSRRPNSLHACLLSLLFLLLASPVALFDLGFQLSYLAVLGILLLSPLLSFPRSWSIRLRPASHFHLSFFQKTGYKLRYVCVHGLWSLSMVTLSAQIATLPLLVFVFHQVPLLALFSNFVVLPMAYVLLGGSLCFFAFPVLRTALSEMMSGSLQTSEAMLHFLSQLPFSTQEVFISRYFMFVFYAFLLGGCAYFRYWNRSHWHRHLLPKLCIIVVFFIFFCLDQHLLRRPVSGTWLYYHPSNLLVHHIAPNGQSWLLSADTLAARHQLRSTARNYWRLKDLQPHFVSLSQLQKLAPNPLIFPTNSDKSHQAIFFFRHSTLFLRQRWVYLNKSLPTSLPQKALAVDFLLLGKGCKRPLREILSFYRPQQIILAANLSDFYRQKYLHESQQQGFSVCDLSKEGAIFIPNT